MTICPKHIHFSINLVLLLAVIIICSYSPSFSLADDSTFSTYEISIQDELPIVSPVLIIVCKANRKYLGSDSLRTGEIFKFTYNVSNISPVYHVFCNIKVGGKQGLYGIFSYRRDLERCGDDHKCLWTVTIPGIYQYYDGYQHLIYPW